MLSDTDEFVNFSDDENAVTLSLDAFSLSSRKSSPRLNHSDQLTNGKCTKNKSLTFHESEERSRGDISNDKHIVSHSIDTLSSLTTEMRDRQDDTDSGYNDVKSKDDILNDTNEIKPTQDSNGRKTNGVPILDVEENAEELKTNWKGCQEQSAGQYDRNDIKRKNETIDDVISHEAACVRAKTVTHQELSKRFYPVQFVTKEEDILISSIAPTPLPGNYSLCHKANSLDYEHSKQTSLDSMPISEEVESEETSDSDEVFVDYSSYSDDTLDIESDRSGTLSPDNDQRGDSQSMINQNERRPSLDTSKANVNSFNESDKLDREDEDNDENRESTESGNSNDIGETVRQNNIGIQYSEATVLNLNTMTSSNASESFNTRINNGDSTYLLDENLKQGTILVPTGRITVYDQDYKIITNYSHRRDDQTSTFTDNQCPSRSSDYTSSASSLGNKHLVQRTGEQSSLLDGNHIKLPKSPDKTSLQLKHKEATLPDIQPRRHKSDIHVAKETPEKNLHKQDYTKEIIKISKEKERKIKLIYDQSTLERKQYLIRLKQKHKLHTRIQRSTVLLDRRSQNSQLEEKRESSIVKNNVSSKQEYGKEYAIRNGESCLDVKQRGTCMLSKIEIAKPIRKRGKQIDINAFHNEIFAINAKAMEEHRRSTAVQSNKIDLITIGSAVTDYDTLSNQSTTSNWMPVCDTSKTNDHYVDKLITNTNIVQKDKNKISNSTGINKNESEDRVSSDRNRNLLKIETGTEHVSRLSSRSWADVDKTNYNRGTSSVNLLHEDYTSGNCNTNPSCERYSTETTTFSDSKQRSGYNTQFSRNGRIDIATGRGKLSSDRNSVLHGALCKKHRTPRVDTRVKHTRRKSGINSKKECSQSFLEKKKTVHNSDPVDNSSTCEMSGKLRQRNSSGLADLARLQDIRRELLLTESEVDDAIIDGYIFTNEPFEKQRAKRLIRKNEASYIVQELLHEVLRKVCRNHSGYRNSELRLKRCTTVDDGGSDVLRCILQAPHHKIDLSSFSCMVLDPLDVPRVTGNHELLISQIILLTADETTQLTQESELVVSIPIAKDYVVPWQEVVIKELDQRGRWTDNGEPADIVNIDDTGKVVYCVQLLLKDLTSVAVIARPKSNCLPLGNQSRTVTSSADPRVKMRVPSTSEMEGGEKHVTLQVVPIEHKLLTEFKKSRYQTQDIDITAASSLIVMTLTGQTPETVYFIAKCVRTSQTDELSKSMNETTCMRLNGCQNSREATHLLGLKAKEHLPVPKQTLTSRSSNNKSDNEGRSGKDMHLVQIGEDSEVRLKLLEDNEREITHNGREHTVRFAVYDKSVRLLALETRSGLQYSEIQRLAQSFTDFVVKHRVRLRVGQDNRNIYSVHFSMTSNLPYKQDRSRKKDSFSSNHLSTILQIDEGDLVGVVFRGNIDVLNQSQRVYSFHGYRGINKTFDIQVGDTFSQRSLQSFHGGVKIFTLKGPRPSPMDKLEMPTLRANWELRAEFPLILPKFLKKSPVTINKAPVSLRFQEPLTVDFISKICTELVEDWGQFATALGISHARIQSIRQQNRNVISERMLMDIVVCWMKQQPISRDKVGPMMHALTSCKKWKLAAELGKRYDAMSINRSQYREKKLQRSIVLVSKSKHVNSKWKHLYTHLSREEKSEDELKKNMAALETKYESEATKCYRALCRWKAETTSSPSVWTLVDALRCCQCTDAAESLTVMESKRT